VAKIIKIGQRFTKLFKNKNRLRNAIHHHVMSDVKDQELVLTATVCATSDISIDIERL